MRKYIITGGPCTGKTTTLGHLYSRMAFWFVPEVARRIIREEEKKEKACPGYKGVFPWSDMEGFQKKAVKEQLDLESRMENNNREGRDVLLDRSVLVESIAYLENKGISVGDSNVGGRIYDLVKEAGYSRVFFMEQIPYKKDHERREDMEEAKNIHEKIYEVYDRFGFDIVRIPATGTDKARSIMERTELILANMYDADSMEIEGKYRTDHDPVKEMLSGHHVERKGESREDNRLYDFMGILERNGCILRLRDNGKFLLTVKGPDKGGLVNARFEFEKEIPEGLFSLLRKVLPEKVSYRKTREAYVPLGDKSCEICLDYVDGKGYFVEIEASSENQVLLWKERLGISSGLIKLPYYKL